MVIVDTWIRNGTVVDPDKQIVEVRDIFVRDGKFVLNNNQDSIKAEQVVEAKGCIITPGLIDNHTHLFTGASELGYQADSNLFPMGVTAAIDAGSSGVADFISFLHTVIQSSRVKVFCNLNVSSTGQISEALPENLNPDKFNVSKMRELFRQYGYYIHGLKIRCDENVVGKYGIKPLVEAKKIAREIGTFLVVHVTNPPVEIGNMADVLEKGDLFTHCYQGNNSTILDNQNIIKLKIREARERGVLFDSADARGNHAYRVLKPAVKQGFWPDIISTDTTQASVLGDMLYGLPFVLSKYLSLGMPILDAITACTSKPAKLLSLEGKIGTLKEGASADITIFRLKKKKVVFRNYAGETYEGNQLLVPLMTLVGGRFMYRSIETISS